MDTITQWGNLSSVLQLLVVCVCLATEKIVCLQHCCCCCCCCLDLVLLLSRYQQQILEAEAQLKQLREQQRTLNGSHNNGLEQLGMLGDLLQLVQLKLRLTQQGGGLVEGLARDAGQQGACGTTVAAAKSFHTATANVMVL